MRGSFTPDIFYSVSQSFSCTTHSNRLSFQQIRIHTGLSLTSSFLHEHLRHAPLEHSDSPPWTPPTSVLYSKMAVSDQAAFSLIHGHSVHSHVTMPLAGYGSIVAPRMYLCPRRGQLSCARVSNSEKCRRVRRVVRGAISKSQVWAGMGQVVTGL